MIITYDLQRHASLQGGVSFIPLGNQFENKVETIEFDFPKEWDGYSKQFGAIHENGTDKYLVPMISNKIHIVDEISQFSGAWYLYVVLQKDDIRIITDYVLGIVDTNDICKLENTVVDPNIQFAYEKMVELNNTLKHAYEIGALKGEKGDQGVQGPQGIPGKDGNVTQEYVNLANQMHQDAAVVSQSALDAKASAESASQSIERVSLISAKFDTKVNQANTDFDSKVSQANTTIDTKVNQAKASADASKLSETNVKASETKITEEVKKVSDSVAQIEQNKMDILSRVPIAQGVENKGKILGVGEDGNVSPIEFKGGSENILIGSVPKQENPCVTDSYVGDFRNLKFYGKSTQDGTPTPTTPVEITSIDKIDCKVIGKNLFDVEYLRKTQDSWQQDSYYYLPIKVKKGLKFSFSIKKRLAPGLPFFCLLGQQKGVTDNAYGWIYHNSVQNLIKQNGTFVAKEDVIYLNFSVAKEQSNINSLFENIFNDLQIEIYYEPTSYEPYKEQHIQYTPPKPLYSTLDGKIADEVDIVNGVYRYNMTSYTMNNINGLIKGTEQVKTVCFRLEAYDLNICPQHNVNVVGCNKFNMINDKTDVEHFYNDVFENKVRFIYIYINKERLKDVSVEGFKEWLKNNPLTFVYSIKTPTTEPIPQETINQLKSLKTYTGTVNVICNAPVSFEYEQSVQIVINNIIKSLQKQTVNYQRSQEQQLAMMSLLPTETQATMIENDQNNLLGGIK